MASKVAVITGAANGLGKALALEYFARGFDLALLDVDLKGLETLRTTLSGQGQVISIHHTDISKEEQVIAARRHILEQHRGIDILINNAGVSISQPFDLVSMDDFRWLFDINFWGTVYCTRHFLKDLDKDSPTNIVNIISAFALLGFPGKSCYAASKAAIMGFTNVLHTELAGSNIRLSLVIPPPLNTRIVMTGPHIDEGHREREAAFLARNGMDLSKAAHSIASQVAKGKYRIMVGTKTAVVDLLSRALPTTMLQYIGRNKQRWDFV
jgi:short-subunit dehydrogenase